MTTNYEQIKQGIATITRTWGDIIEAVASDSRMDPDAQDRLIKSYQYLIAGASHALQVVENVERENT